jgi:arylsulfatase A-like enzyme
VAKIQRQLVYREFPIEDLEGLCNGAVSADELVKRIHATGEKAKQQGFDDFYIFGTAIRDDDYCDKVKLSLRGSRPETRDEQGQREAEELQRSVEQLKRDQKQRTAATEMVRSVARGAVRGLTQKEVLALWREAQEEA